MTLIYSVLSAVILGALIPVLHRVSPRITGWVVALLPLGLFVCFVQLMPHVTADGSVVAVWERCHIVGPAEISLYVY
jgi:hypothetical protein